MAETNNGGSSGGGAKALKRYGPILLVVVIIGAVIAIASGGGDDDDERRPPPTPTGDNSDLPMTYEEARGGGDRGRHRVGRGVRHRARTGQGPHLQRGALRRAVGRDRGQRGRHRARA